MSVLTRLKDRLRHAGKEQEELAFALAQKAVESIDIPPDAGPLTLLCEIGRASNLMRKEGTLHLAMHNFMMGTTLRIISGESATEVIDNQILKDNE